MPCINAQRCDLRVGPIPTAIAAPNRNKTGIPLASHVGIELSPGACRIVEIAGEGDSGDRSVATYATAPRASSAAIEWLSLLRGRHATVVVWGTTTDHQVVAVAPGSYERMRAEARATARKSGSQPWQTLTDIAPVPEMGRGAAHSRPVVMASAAADEVSAMLRPLVAAGIRIDSVLTPAAALLSLARARRALSPRGAIEAYVAIDENVVSFALIRDLALVAATDFAWGYVEERGDCRVVRPREEIVARLDAGLTTVLAGCRVDRSALRQVCICGGVPELRSMSMTWMERIEVEVEPLDSLFGIDHTRLPGGAGDFRERAPELRLAWAAAADDRPPLDLLRAGRRRAQTMSFSRAAVAAGIATGLILGSQVAPSVAAVVRPGPTARPASAPKPRSVRPPIRPYVPATHVGSPSVGPTFRSGDSSRSGASASGASIRLGDSGSKGASGAAEIASAPEPAHNTIQPRPAAPGPVAPDLKVGRLGPSGATRGRGGSGSNRPNIEARSDARERPESPPFTATIQGILFGDRKLAIVNGRIVQPGDEIGGAQVIDITATTVVFKDANGRLRSLSGGAADR